MKKIAILTAICMCFLLNTHAQTTPKMIKVEGGTFTMGDSEMEGEKDEQPTHQVTLKTFSIAKTETTVLQWKTFCAATGRKMPEPPSFGAIVAYIDGSIDGWIDSHPIVNIDWDDAVAYCDWLSKKMDADYHLPTEAEWEYAARGGKLSKGTKYSGGLSLDKAGVYDDYFDEETQAVATEKPNELGLYDMSGNVWEWCKDWYKEYSAEAQTNPKGATSGTYRVLRGGCWSGTSGSCRVADRNFSGPRVRTSNFGFRVVLSQYIGTQDQNYPEMLKVEGGTFTMGDNNGSSNETPTHSVTLSSYSIGKYTVTVGQYKAFCSAIGREMPYKPAWGWKNNHPMVLVNYNDCVAYCNWLGEEYGGSWRLPTEAEWEYAARGGYKSGKFQYSGGSDLDELGWYAGNSGGQTNYVGRKKPNELGIYDMSGNVWEWCKDWYGSYSAEAQTNPKGPASGTSRVLRGGSWDNTSTSCRVANRGSRGPTDRYSGYGFRVVLSQ